MSNADVAKFLGIAPDSVTNWLAVKSYISPVVDAMDKGELSMHSARVFDGMSEQGQKAIWKDHQRDFELPAQLLHKKIRTEYPPTKFPGYYRNPEQITKRLARETGKRKGVQRTSYSPDEKKKLRTSYEMKELELAERTEELETLTKSIRAAVIPITAILRNKTLLALVPEAMRDELTFFAESCG
jgi:alpha-galactosidase/6-phospho-beta-glucosidase family protein